METADKILICDEACPMCAGYTKLFVQRGMLNPGSRQNFSSVDTAILSRIDINKCRNEIPFIDTTGNKVLYGIDAMLEIMSAKLPFVKTIGTIRPVNWFLKKLYNLISYNRRVITANNTTGYFDCTPDFNAPYRILLLFIGFCFNTLMLTPEYNMVFLNSTLSKASMLQMQAAHLMLVGINLILPFQLSYKKALEFLGQVNITAIIYSLLLIPIIWLNKLFSVPVPVNNVCLFIVFCIIIITYRRRMQYARIFEYRYIIIIEAIASALFVGYLAF